MFNWTTTTIINELPLMKSEMDGKALRIGKHLFEKRWVESIRKATGKNMELCEATVNLNDVDFKQATVARLYIYVGLEGSEESIYANDWYRKGMPLSVSFAVTDATNMAKAIVDTVKTFNVFTKVKKVLEVTENAGVLTIKGTHEHQRLQKIQIFVEQGTAPFTEEVAVVNYELNRKADANVREVNKGRNGFGTYSQLIKDLRLPTAVHTNWLSVQKDEMPVVGSLYTQYIITYYAPSTANPSFTAIGNRSMSETTHVFWVNTEAPAKDEEGNPSTVGAEWEKALATIDPDGDSNLGTIPGELSGIFNNKIESLVERIENLENKE